MQPHIASLLTVAWVFLGGTAAMFILEARGLLKKAKQTQALTWAHRICGYGFALLFAVLGGCMIYRSAGYQSEFSPRILLHIALAAAMAPLLLFKILIGRRYRKYYAYLPALGGLLLTASVVITALTAGYYFLHRGDITYTELSPHDTDVLDLDLGRALLPKKCAKCHALDRVLRASKDRSGWTRTVNRMAAKDAPNIRPFDVKQLIYILSPAKSAPLTEKSGPQTTSGETIVQKKCAGCHPLDRVFNKERTFKGWGAIIERMVENAEEIGEYDFLSPDEKNMLARHLSNRP